MVIFFNRIAEFFRIDRMPQQIKPMFSEVFCVSVVLNFTQSANGLLHESGIFHR